MPLPQLAAHLMLRTSHPARALSLRGWEPVVFALALTCALALPEAARAQWTDVTTPELADTTWTRDKKGVAFVDFDGDGDLDICAVGEGLHPGSLFRNAFGQVVDMGAGIGSLAAADNARCPQHHLVGLWHQAVAMDINGTPALGATRA